MGDTVAETATLPNEPVDKLTPSELNTDANSDANSVNTTVNDKSSDGDSSTPTIGSTKEDQRDTSSNSNDVDQNAYSALSDQVNIRGFVLFILPYACFISPYILFLLFAR